MAHGEADHGCAQGEPCRPGHHDQSGAVRPHRRLVALPVPIDQVCWAPEWADEEVSLPRQRDAETAVPGGVEPGPPPHAAESDHSAPRSCRSDLAGWAGAHRHGPVRPSRRPQRRERPPHRWC
ncbi:hypothetical protein V6U81_07200 [Micromonospora sp. CPCC 205711]|uniref:hypothetical protein n=1 Tax=Micromonospora sp. CPCC 205547 TaxID=3122400 RepID=UPI002FEFA86A